MADPHRRDDAASRSPIPPATLHLALQSLFAKKSICSLHLSQMVTKPSFSSVSLPAHDGITR